MSLGSRTSSRTVRAALAALVLGTTLALVPTSAQAETADPDGTPTVAPSTPAPTSAPTTAAPSPEPTAQAPEPTVEATPTPSSPPRARALAAAAAPAAPVITFPTQPSRVRLAAVEVRGTGQPGAVVQVLDGYTEALVCVATVTQQGTWSCRPSALVGRSYAIFAVQIDGGQTSPISNAVTYLVHNDQLAPPVFTAPANGITVPGPFVEIRGTAEAGTTVTVRSPSMFGSLCVVTTKADGTWACSPGILPGTHDLSAVAMMDGAPASATSSTVTVHVGSKPSPPVITTPTSGGSVRTLEIGGTGEVGATVDVHEGATLLCTVSVNGSGRWSCAVSASEGPHTITARQTLQFSSEDSTPVSFVVDRTAPSAPTLVTPAAGALVNTRNVAFSGRGEPRATVRVHLADGTQACEAAVAADGTWSCTASLEPGRVDLRVHQIDEAGNLGGLVERSLTIDVTAPDAPVITSPATGSVLRGPGLTVSGSGEPGATLTLLYDGSAFVSTTVGSTGLWSFDIGVAEGLHTLGAQQTDAAGNRSPRANVVTVSVDRTPPQRPRVQSPAAGSLVRTGSPTIVGTAEAGTTVRVTEGVRPICTTVATGGVWVCIPTDVLSEGSHSLTVTSTDAVGNVSPAEYVSFTVDSTAPAAPVLSSPANGSVSAVRAPTVSGSGEAGATVEVRDASDALVCSTTVRSGGAWTCESSALAEGSHVIRARQTDAAGNVSPASAPVAFTVDTTAPEAPQITAPTAGVTKAQRPTVSGVGEAGALVTVRDGGANVCSATVGSEGAWNCVPWSGLAEGVHVLTAIQQDVAGNSSAASAGVALTVDVTAPDAPAITGPADGSVLGTSRPTIRGTGEPGADVVVRDESGDALLLVTTVRDDGSWSGVSSSELADGRHVLAALQADPAGNTSEVSVRVTFEVDTQAPAAPVIGEPADGSSTGDATPRVSGTGESGAQVTVRTADAVVCTATVGSSGAWDCTPPALPDGTYVLSARQVDVAGNRSPVSGDVRFTVDTATPAPVTVTGPAAGAEPLDGAPALTGEGEPGATVTVLDARGDVVCTAVVDADRTWRCAPAAPLPDGRHVLSVVQTDEAGNASAPASMTITVDTTPGLQVSLRGELADVDGDGAADRGEIVTWRTTVTNTGRVSLHRLVVDDAGQGPVPARVRVAAVQACPLTELAPGESVTCESADIVTAADVTAGKVTNSVSASAVVLGTDARGRTVTTRVGDVVGSASVSAEIVVPAEPTDTGTGTDPDETTGREDADGGIGETTDDERAATTTDAASRRLADTGAGLSWQLGAAGVGALGLGAWLLTAARRRRDEAA